MCSLSHHSIYNMSGRHPIGCKSLTIGRFKTLIGGFFSSRCPVAGNDNDDGGD